MVSLQNKHEPNQPITIWPLNNVSYVLFSYSDLSIERPLGNSLGHGQGSEQVSIMERRYPAAGALENIILPPLTSRISLLLSSFRHCPEGDLGAVWHEGKIVGDVSSFSSSRRGCWNGPVDERRILYSS